MKKSIHSIDLKKDSLKTLNSKIIDNLTNTMNEILNFQFKFDRFYIFLTLYDKFSFDMIKFIFILKNLS